jgi:hypothetical protein
VLLQTTSLQKTTRSYQTPGHKISLGRLVGPWLWFLKVAMSIEFSPTSKEALVKTQNRKTDCSSERHKTKARKLTTRRRYSVRTMIADNDRWRWRRRSFDSLASKQKTPKEKEFLVSSPSLYLVSQQSSSISSILLIIIHYFIPSSELHKPPSWMQTAYSSSTNPSKYGNESGLRSKPLSAAKP